MPKLYRLILIPITILSCMILVLHQSKGQRGTVQLATFGGQSYYLIDKNTSSSNFLYNHVGMSYGVYVTNRISLIGSNEVGSLFENKVVFSPSISSLSSTYFSGSLGLQVPLIQMQKFSFLINAGTTYQSIENACNCTTGERYRREYSSFLGAQLHRKINERWSIFLGGQLSKPMSTTLNDPDFYMSNNRTDSNKDYMFKYSIGIAYNIPFTSSKDTDKDGVQNKMDKCPNTPKGEKVNQEGCPIQDDDQDGIENAIDK